MFGCFNFSIDRTVYCVRVGFDSSLTGYLFSPQNTIQKLKVTIVELEGHRRLSR